jgi:hypothetical protein
LRHPDQPRDLLLNINGGESRDEVIGQILAQGYSREEAEKLADLVGEYKERIEDKSRG